MKTVCERNQCAGCQACVNVCAVNAIRIEDSLQAYNAVINEKTCINCGQCEKVCAVNHPLNGNKPIRWAQGWALDENVRKCASSGGLAAALQYGFIESGGVVCSCLFRDGEFIFDFAAEAEDIKKFSGSKYVKSNPGRVYGKIKAMLAEGKKVLFVGLPCQCAAVRKYVKDHELLYTVDLICHGTPSPKHLEHFLSEKGINMDGAGNVNFRNKMTFRVSVDGKGVEPRSVRDRYTMAFLKSLCYTENCYSCEYTSTARVSDITLGDSWGSTLAAEEQAKGISLVLCQTAKGQALLDAARIHLEEVDVEQAVLNNKQLSHPSPKPVQYETFYAGLQAKKNFHKAVAGCYPKECFRQRVKTLAVRLGLK